MNSTYYTKTSNQSISVTVIHLSPTQAKYVGVAVLQLITLQWNQGGETRNSVKPCK